MPEYLSPGVYVEEFEIGARPIEGVSTSTAGFLGEAERGPTTPTFVTGWLDYQRRFGSYFGANKYLPHAVQGFFDNGGQRCFIGRIVKSGNAPATAAALTLKAEGSNALIAEAVGEGSWGNRIAVKVSVGSMSGFRLVVFYWKKAPSQLFDPETDIRTTPRPDATEEFDNLSDNESDPDYYEKRVKLSNFIRLSKQGSGAVPDEHIGVAQGGAAGTITLASTASSTNDAYVGMWIQIIEGTGKGQIRSITDYNGTTRVADVNSNWTTVPGSGSKYSIYSIRTLRGGTDSSVHKGTAQAGSANSITLAGNASSTNDAYNDKTVEIIDGRGKGQKRTISDYDGTTKVATVAPDWTTGADPDITTVYNVYPAPVTLVSADYERTDSNQPGNRKGLTGFAEVDDISLVYAPNAQGIPNLVDAIINQCENLKDRFAIIDAPKDSPDVTALNPRSARSTSYAAYYYPWIKISHPESGALYLVPPGGHIAGIYARSDTERGVHKAPANETVRGAKMLEFPVTKGEQDILNPKGVNVIRSFRDRGILVWGARTLSTNSLWKYINVRRLFIYVEESIEKGTQWVVFEPNNEKLWARVRATVTQFLTSVWRDGALMGTKAEEAFFVKCDRSTMTQDEIDNGKLIIIIGIAPVKPAEFVIIRITQWAGGSAPKE